MDKLETELKNQRKPGFQPGVSGNPKGKPKGARCRVTVLAEKLMADNAQAAFALRRGGAHAQQRVLRNVQIQRPQAIVIQTRDRARRFSQIETGTLGEQVVSRHLRH